MLLIKKHNNRIHSESKKRHSFVALFLLPVIRGVIFLRKPMTELNYSSLYEEISEFKALSGEIKELSIEAFQEVYGSQDAAEAKQVVYVFLSQKPVPRLVGESNILYIGQTKNSFRARRNKDAKLHATSKANSLKFSAILKNYGAITVRVCDYKKYGKTLQEAEGQLLWWYFQNHYEYPPINYTKTKNRNDVVKI